MNLIMILLIIGIIIILGLIIYIIFIKSITSVKSTLSGLSTTPNINTTTPNINTTTPNINTTSSSTTTPIPANSIYFKKPIYLVNNSNLKLKILYSFDTIADYLYSVSINFTSDPPTSFECTSTNYVKNNIQTPIRNNDIIRIHEINGKNRYISTYDSRECTSYDCIFNYDNANSVALGYNSQDPYKVFAFLDNYNKYYDNTIDLPVSADNLDFTIVCFDSNDTEITDPNYIVTTGTKFRLKIKNKYLDGNPTCNTYPSANGKKFCNLNLVPITTKTTSQLFTFMY